MKIAQRLEVVGGRPSGFDYMRLVLAVGVICIHGTLISYGRAADLALWATPFRPLLKLVVPSFFALSGFLVAGSLERCKTLISFLGLRAIRIYPALGVEVVLSAFILGPVLTVGTLSHYFSDPQTRAYLLNALGDIHYKLPGVFATNPYPDYVNGQLWTVPFELACYGALSALALAGVVRRRILSVLAAVALTAFYAIGRLHHHGWHYEAFEGSMTGTMLVIAFLVGVSIYLYRDKLPWSLAWFMASLGSAVVLSSYVPFGEYVSPFAIAYVVAYLGLCNPPRLAVIRAADYSYGIYLYGFAIQQLVASWGPWTHQPLINVAISLPLATAFAALSWHLVEKPALGLKARAYQVEAYFLAMLSNIRPVANGLAKRSQRRAG